MDTSGIKDRQTLVARLDDLLSAAPKSVATSIKARASRILKQAIRARRQLEWSTSASKDQLVLAATVSRQRNDQLRGLSPFVLHVLGARPLAADHWTVGGTALVFSGGGAKGSFQAGALASLKTRWEQINPSLICGSSVGAINAIAVAQDGHPGINYLLSTYTSLRHRGDMYRLSPELQQIDDILRTHYDTNVASLMGQSSHLPDLAIASPANVTLATGANLLATLFLGPELGAAASAFLGLTLVEQTAETHLRRLRRIASLLKKAASLYSLDPTADHLRQFLKPDREMMYSLRMATVDLCTGETCYVDENGKLLIGDAADPEDTWEIDPGLSRVERIVRGALASSAIPAVFPAVQMRKSPSVVGHFVDGGVREILPTFAAKRLGASRIIAISAAPLDVPYMRLDMGQVPMSTAGLRGMTLAIDEVARDEHSPPNGWNDAIARTHIFPQIEVHDTLTIDPGFIRINIDYGYMVAHDTLLAQDEAQDFCPLLLAIVAAQAIIETRMEIKILEEKMILRNGGIVFDEAILQEVRALKRSVHSMSKARLAALGGNRVGLPWSLQGEAGAPVAQAKDWWEQWERHGVAISQDLEGYSPWDALPIGRDLFGELVLEDPALVPSPPSTDEI